MKKRSKMKSRDLDLWPDCSIKLALRMPRDHNHRNRCSKINYHPDSGNRWDCQFSKANIKVRLFAKTNIKVPPPPQLILIELSLNVGTLLSQNWTTWFNPLLSETLLVAVILLIICEAIIYFCKDSRCLLNVFLIYFKSKFLEPA